MDNSAPTPGGQLEHAVMLALWKLKRASAREIYAEVGEPRGLVYTSVAKVLERLCAKGLAQREGSGKSFVYRANLARDVVQRAWAVNMLTRLLGTEPRPAMATLVEAVESIDPKLLDELSRAVEARVRPDRGA